MECASLSIAKILSITFNIISNAFRNFILYFSNIETAEKAKAVSITSKSAVKSDEEVASAFDKFGNSILRLAYSYLHNMDDSEDILQETLIRYMKNAPAFESDEHEKAWLLRLPLIFQRIR